MYKRPLIQKRLATKRPDMADVGRELAMSERTLQRRLAEEGTRFQDVLAAARRELAHQYLVDGQLDMGDAVFDRDRDPLAFHLSPFTPRWSR